MKSIEWVDVTPTGERDPHFCCEASDIGLPPGGWPHHLKTGLGNGQDFVKQYRADDGQGYIYQQQGGDLRLLIIND